MPLWGAAALLLIGIIGTVMSFRAYARGGGKIFLASGIVLSLFSIAALLYVAMVLLFISAVD